MSEKYDRIISSIETVKQKNRDQLAAKNAEIEQREQDNQQIIAKNKQIIKESGIVELFQEILEKGPIKSGRIEEYNNGIVLKYNYESKAWGGADIEIQYHDEIRVQLNEGELGVIIYDQKIHDKRWIKIENDQMPELIAQAILHPVNTFYE